MNTILNQLFSFFRPSSPVPDQFKRVFFHLYMDMAWMGLVSGTTMAFIGVYATRQGANPTQIGLLSAVSGLVNLLFALPASNWVRRRSIGKSVFGASAFARIFYLFLVPLPVLLMPEMQVWMIIIITFLMTIPGTALVVGFNAMFAEIVPHEWRGHVIGIRNAFLAVVATVFTFLSGYVLDVISFPLGYQIIFLVGFIGAALSSLHLYILSTISNSQISGNNYGTDDKKKKLSSTHHVSDDINLLLRRSVEGLHLDVMRGPFLKIMGLLFCWHLIQFMTIPCITPYIVNQLRISDQQIGLANGLFNLTTFLGSLQLGQIAFRFGYKRITSVGIMLLSFFPILTSFGIAAYVLANLIGGIGWAMVGGGLYNFLLEKMPSDNRPAYLAWYNLVSNAAILIGSLSGPVVGDMMGIPVALVIFGIGRFLAGAAILRWG